MKKICCLALLVILINACSTNVSSQGNSSPEWLTNPTKFYPNQLYLTAIGEGSNRSQAIENAAVNLTRIFEVRIESENIFQQRYEEISSKQSATATTETIIDESIRIASDQNLHNINYAESYTDNLGRVYVLAYINRMDTGDLYQNMIEENQKNILFFLNKAENTEDYLSRYSYYSTSLLYSYANQNLLEQLDIIYPDAKHFINLEYNHNHILDRAFNTARQITFSINISDDDARYVQNSLSEIINELGFSIARESLLNITGELSIEKMDLSRPQSFVRWQYSVFIQDNDQNTLISHSNYGREGHINHQEAVARANRIVAQDVRRNLKDKIFNYFEQLSLK